MRKIVGLFVVCLVSVPVFGEMVLFRTSTNYVTTGAVLDDAKVANEAFTTNVQEIAGLELTIRTDDPESMLWANSRSFGVNAATNADEAARFEVDEKVILSFSKDVEISFFDFRNFDAGEAFHFAVSNQPVFTIHHEDQDNTTSDYTSTNLFIAANTEVEVYVTTTGNVGFEGLDINVVEHSAPVRLSIVMSNGFPVVCADVNEPGGYVLQSSTNLATNVWTNFSASFTGATNCMMKSIDPAVFIRAVPE